MNIEHEENVEIEDFSDTPDYFEETGLKDDLEGLTDTTDYAEKEIKSGQRKVLLTIASIFVTVIAFVVIIVFTVTRNPVDKSVAAPQQPLPSISADSEISVAPDAKPTDKETITDLPVGPTNPIKEKLNLPLTPLAESSAKIENNGISFSSGAYLSVLFTGTDPALSECIISEPSDFCFLGTGTVKGSEIALYYLKDAANSRFFDNATNLEIIDISNVKMAGTVDLAESFNQSFNQKIGFIVLNDQSGVMINFIEPANTENFTEVVKSFS